ncbi:MAG: GH25 family lysozyme [Acutalibacter sp.]
MAIKGVDISEHNGSVDFQALKNAGVGFAIIRTGFGSDYPGQQDKRFAENVRKADAAGMPWGVYHYSYARDRQGGVDEARHCLRLLGGKKPLYGVWYDMEDNSTLGGDLLGAAQGFCDTIEAAGLYAGVYASLNWWNNYLTAPGFDQYDRWVAQYYSQCQYKGAYGMWQYTSTWSIGGKNFDGNWAYKDYPALVRAMDKEEPELTEAEVKKIARQEIEAYFNELAKKPVSNWAKEAVEFVQAEGLMNGDADGNFRPQSPITRQEVAAVLMNEREK